ncbi:MAG: hypothetical protein Q4G16_09400 [Cruoricaptor ignavus]|nr:hypothetical protein [Cruoricaptor ignavus]
MKNPIIYALLFLLLGTIVQAQLSTAFYGNANNVKFGIGYQFSDKIWAEARVYSDTKIDNIVPEFTANYNFVRANNYDAYVGAGVLVSNSTNGFILPVGVAIKPLENLKNLSLNIEMNPIYEWDLSEFYIRGFFGVRYILK